MIVASIGRNFNEFQLDSVQPCVELTPRILQELRTYLLKRVQIFEEKHIARYVNPSV